MDWRTFWVLSLCMYVFVCQVGQGIFRYKSSSDASIDHLTSLIIASALTLSYAILVGSNGQQSGWKEKEEEGLEMKSHEYICLTQNTKDSLLYSTETIMVRTFGLNKFSLEYLVSIYAYQVCSYFILNSI